MGDEVRLSDSGAFSPALSPHSRVRSTALRADSNTWAAARQPPIARRRESIDSERRTSGGGLFAKARSALSVRSVRNLFSPSSASLPRGSDMYSDAPQRASVAAAMAIDMTEEGFDAPSATREEAEESVVVNVVDQNNGSYADMRVGNTEFETNDAEYKTDGPSYRSDIASPSGATVSNRSRRVGPSGMRKIFAGRKSEADGYRLNVRTLHLEPKSIEREFSQRLCRLNMRMARQSRWIYIAMLLFYTIATFIDSDLHPALLTIGLATALVLMCMTYIYQKFPILKTVFFTELILLTTVFGCVCVFIAYRIVVPERNNEIDVPMLAFNILGTTLFQLRFPTATVFSCLLLLTDCLLSLKLGTHPVTAMRLRSCVAHMAVMMAGVCINYANQRYLRERFLERKRVESERRSLHFEKSSADYLLSLTLPKSTIELLKSINCQQFSEAADDAAVLFADIDDTLLQEIAKTLRERVACLNILFSEFDDVCDDLGVEKIKTTGTKYMVAAGIPRPCHEHTAKLALLGHRIIQICAARKMRVKIGIHRGKIVGGIVGKLKFCYDVFGDTVNTASRMCTTCPQPMAVHVSSAAADALVGRFKLESCGTIEVKGKGAMETFLVLEELILDEPIVPQIPTGDDLLKESLYDSAVGSSIRDSSGSDESATDRVSTATNATTATTFATTTTSASTAAKPAPRDGSGGMDANTVPLSDDDTDVALPGSVPHYSALEDADEAKRIAWQKKSRRGTVFEGTRPSMSTGPAPSPMLSSAAGAKSAVGRRNTGDTPFTNGLVRTAAVETGTLMQTGVFGSRDVLANKAEHSGSRASAMEEVTGGDFLDLVHDFVESDSYEPRKWRSVVLLGMQKWTLWFHSKRLEAEYLRVTWRREKPILFKFSLFLWAVYALLGVADYLLREGRNATLAWQLRAVGVTIFLTFLLSCTYLTKQIAAVFRILFRMRVEYGVIFRWLGSGELVAFFVFALIAVILTDSPSRPEAGDLLSGSLMLSMVGVIGLPAMHMIFVSYIISVSVLLGWLPGLFYAYYEGTHETVALWRALLGIGIVVGLAMPCLFNREFSNRESFIAVRVFERQRERISTEHRFAENMLSNIMPRSVVERLKRDASNLLIADSIDLASVLCMDVVSFTTMCSKLLPMQVITILNTLFTEFDNAVEALGIEKICTIGDAYIACAGLLQYDSDHVRKACRLASDMIASTKGISDRFSAETEGPISVRIGVHAGPCLAAVVGGRTRFKYDVWGPCLDTATMLEQTGQPGFIHISAEAARYLETVDVDIAVPLPFDLKNAVKRSILIDGVAVETLLIEPIVAAKSAVHSNTGSSATLGGGLSVADLFASLAHRSARPSDTKSMTPQGSFHRGDSFTSRITAVEEITSSNGSMTSAPRSFARKLSEAAATVRGTLSRNPDFGSTGSFGGGGLSALSRLRKSSRQSSSTLADIGGMQRRVVVGADGVETVLMELEHPMEEDEFE
eukprot:Opistho-2@43783